MQHSFDDCVADKIEDSTNQNIELTESELSITGVEQTSSEEIVKMTSSNGSVFFIRTVYLQTINVEDIKNRVSVAGFSGAEFSEEEAKDIVRAGFAFGAEQKACDYLSRCEQCRFKLTQKLIQKNFPNDSVELALNWLESKNYLSDSRFAYIWVRNHCLTKYQGKIRLLSELLSRGISSSIANEAIDSYFSEDSERFVMTEEEMCEKAYNKAIRLRKSGEKLVKYLSDSGFKYKMIQNIIKNNESD